MLTNFEWRSAACEAPAGFHVDERQNAVRVGDSRVRVWAARVGSVRGSLPGVCTCEFADLACRSGGALVWGILCHPRVATPALVEKFSRETRSAQVHTCRRMF